MHQISFDDLYDMVGNNDPLTSYNAARKTNKAEGKRRVYECLLAHPDGLNDSQIAQITGMEKSSAAKRRKDLGELVVWTGKTCPTNTGSQGKIWKLK